jgi:hypothetical protein
MVQLVVFALLILWQPLSSSAQNPESAAACDLSLDPQPIRVSPLHVQLRPGRVLIVRSLDRMDRLKEQQVLVDRLAHHLRRQSLFDVVECKDCVCDATSPIRTALFDERQLLYYASTYGVDSVLYCTVQSIDAYRPMNVELQFVLINIDQAVPAASGSLAFDLANPVTEQVFINTFNYGDVQAVAALSSPSRLIDFAAARLAAELKAVWP